MSNGKFTCAYIANLSVCPKVLWMNNSRITLTFKEICLKQENAVPFTPNNVVNLFIAHELNRWSQDLNTDFTLKLCLFAVAKLTKNADPDKYKYSGYG